MEVAALHPLDLGVAVEDVAERRGVGRRRAPIASMCPMPVANGGWCSATIVGVAGAAASVASSHGELVGVEPAARLAGRVTSRGPRRAPGRR